MSGAQVPDQATWFKTPALVFLAEQVSYFLLVSPSINEDWKQYLLDSVGVNSKSSKVL